MRKGYLGSIILLVAMLLCSPSVRAQNAPSTDGLHLVDGWGRPVVDPLPRGQKPGPAPKHDISGMWQPALGPGDGIMAQGPKDMRSDGNPLHEPPYSALGLQVLKSHKPINGVSFEGSTAGDNDPRNKCDPLGFPRADFYQIRHTQIVQNERQVFMLYQFQKIYRVIWTDGRDFPKEIPQPQYYGYSVGQWVDDNTLVVRTIGITGDEKLWLDEAGRPASDAMQVEERFHRVDYNNLEITVTINDSKMYTKPWVALNKFPMKLQSPDYHATEMMCIPTEMEQYNKDFGDVISGGTDGK